MEINGPNLFTACHLNQRFHVTLMAVHTSVSQKTQQVQPAALVPRLLHCIQKILVPIEPPFINVLVNKSKILVDDAAGTENHVANFGISHLAFRQTDIHSGHRKTRYRKLPSQLIDIRNRSLRNGIALFSWIDSPPIQDHQNHGLLSIQEFFPSFEIFARSARAKRTSKRHLLCTYDSG